MKRDLIITKQRTTRNNKTFETKTQTWYKCLYCQREYLDREKAEECIEKHDLILVPIARNDLNRLNQFLYLKEDALLSESLVSVIQRYTRKAGRE